VRTMMRCGPRRIAILVISLSFAGVLACARIPAGVVRIDKDGAAAPVSSAVAASRSIVVRWQHPDPKGVEHFRIYWGIEAAKYLTYQDVGKPRRGDVFEARLEVPEDATVHLALTALGPGGESPKSNVGVCVPGCIRARPVGPGPFSQGAPGQN
jgi:hypothetical protein